MKFHKRQLILAHNINVATPTIVAKASSPKFIPK